MADLAGAQAVVEVGRFEQTLIEPAGEGLPVVPQFSVMAEMQTLIVKAASADERTPLRVYLYRVSNDATDNEPRFELWELPIEPTTSYAIRDPEPGQWCVIV